MSLNEKEIEKDLIDMLSSELKYIYRRDIRDRETLEKNFRAHFEALNKVALTDNEFSRLCGEIVNADVFKAAQILRERNTFQREDGTPLQYTLVNIKDWCKNTFEVINQFRINTRNNYHRYDVMVLINGIPMVQIELKTLHVDSRRAIEQIVEYKNTPGNGYINTILCFIQLFVVSNRSTTYYFANNNKEHFSFNANERFLPVYQHANENNDKITHMDEFARTFLSKCTLSETISRYMVLVVSEQKLMIMRPYQIYAVKAIVNCIHENRGNGYIWHTTGSGKTLTSFKASTLLKDNPDIEKCLFVVDRKDLDRQTREEFNKFQAGCVEENTNTETLVRRLLSDNYADKVIVTTIQKLGLALDENSKHSRRSKRKGEPTYKERLHALSDKRVVFIFDECHRSQFGKNHKAIKEFFPQAQLFGFTGTPIFEQNAVYTETEGEQASYKTTKDIFQKELHAYTITHAIEDKNVLRFHIDYFEKDGEAQDAARAAHTARTENRTRRAIVNSILARHHKATGEHRFNAIFATNSINNAIEYYTLFKEIQQAKQAEDNTFQPLRIASVFSPPAEGNTDVQQIQEDLPQEKDDNEHEPNKKKDALKRIIADYNAQYGTNHRIDEFDRYYQDIQQRIKNHHYPNITPPYTNKVDITIVVDMLLTGFDSKYLNTLYVDKNLSKHSLIQAFSRTNRVLNKTKPFGNILNFRLRQETIDNAIVLFSGKGDEQAKEIWLVESAPAIIGKLETAITEFEQFMDSQGLPCTPEGVGMLKGNAARSAFIERFKEVQRLKTQLDQYTDIKEEDSTRIETLLPEEQHRAFRGVYLDIAQRLKDEQGPRHNGDVDDDPGGDVDDVGNDPHQLDFELVLFSSATIDYDYIMNLIDQYSQKSTAQKMTRDQLISLVKSSSNLMDEREDIIAYVNSLEPGHTGLSVTERGPNYAPPSESEEALHEEALNTETVSEGYEAFKKQKAARELAKIAEQHGINPTALHTFVDGIMTRMVFDGEGLTQLVKPLQLAWRAKVEKEDALVKDLAPVLRKRAHGRTITGLSAYVQNK